MTPHPRTDWIALARIYSRFYRQGLCDKSRIQFRHCRVRETWFAEAVTAASPRLGPDQRELPWN